MATMTDVLRLIATEEREAIENWVRARARSSYLGDKRALCKVLGKYTMMVSTEDMSLSPHLMLEGFWEMWITQAVAQNVRSGMHCIDVGANCGYYTLLLADLAGDAGSVTAFEPQPTLAAMVKLSLALNGLTGTVHQKAAGEAEGEAQLWRPADFYGGAALGDTPTEGEHTKFDVAVERVDALCKHADFVKIDAEGAEHEVWNGMTRLIDNSGIIVCMEFVPKNCTKPESLLDKIAAAGFKLRKIDERGKIVAHTRQAALSEPWAMLWLQR